MLGDLKESIQILDSSYSEKLEISSKIDSLSMQYDVLLSIFDNAEKTKDSISTERWVSSYIADKVLPRFDLLFDLPNLSDMDIERAAKIYEKHFALCSRRSFHHFILYVEQDRPFKKQVYKNRQSVLHPLVYYLEIMMYHKSLAKLKGSYPPGYGKSFVVNYYSAWAFGVNKDNSILRMSYNDDLLDEVSRSIKDLMCTDRYQQVFPYYAQYGEKIFDKEKNSEWKIKGSDTNSNHIARTRDGGTTGKRANFMIIFDDMTKGKDEANDDNLHKGYKQKYNTEWVNRKSDDTVQETCVGTMWNPNDILGMYEELIQEGSIPKKSKFDFCTEYYNEDNEITGVIINVPLLDENDKATLPCVTSQRAALKLREETDPFLFSCVYQQSPIAPTGRAFAWEELKQYKMFDGKERYIDENGIERKYDFYYNDMPVRLNSTAYAALDPTRKGKDNVSMPICKIDIENPENHFLIDVIYKGSGMDEIMDDLVEKLILHKVTKFVFENNVVGTVFKPIIIEKLKERGYIGCEVIEIYNTINKNIRIRNEKYTILNNMVFPNKSMFPSISEMGKFMEATTTFSLDRDNKNDDAPDSLALYSTNIIKDMNFVPKVELLDRNALGF